MMMAAQMPTNPGVGMEALSLHRTPPIAASDAAMRMLPMGNGVEGEECDEEAPEAYSQSLQSACMEYAFIAHAPEYAYELTEAQDGQ